MIYVAIGILVLLVVGAGVMFLVGASTKDAAPFASDDDTPAGDTGQHAGEQDDGRTVTPNDQQGGATGERTAGAARFKRDPVGGEAEGEPTIEAGPVTRPRGS
ncbi:MAG: hypothetical protein QOE86_627 [Solirubrobacteraceae bacterium]|jgi:hypothetical protein|nr:hypothetical protein [Solirubrobacteraceae bacterium]